MQDELTLVDVVPKWVFDDETPHELQASMEKCNVSYQFVRTYSHRSNITEKLMQAFECYFKSTLVNIDTSFHLVE